MDQLQDYEDWKVYRFQCDCMSPGCCLDFDVTVHEDQRAAIQLGISDSFRAPLWHRIKTVFKYLFRKESLPLAEICLRQDDEEELRQLFNQYGQEGPQEGQTH